MKPSRDSQRVRTLTATLVSLVHEASESARLCTQHLLLPPGFDSNYCDRAIKCVVTGHTPPAHTTLERFGHRSHPAAAHLSPV